MLLAKPQAARKGFTLLELMLVIGVVLVLAALFVMISPRVIDDKRTNGGADNVQGWLLIAKQRAFRDQSPRGIRLIPSADNPNQVKEMVYIERPEDWAGNLIQVPSSVSPPPAPNQMASGFIPNVDLQTGDIVLPGDFLVFDTFETVPENAHRIAIVKYFPPNPPSQPAGGTVLWFAAADNTFRAVAAPIPITTTQNYRIVRQARPLAGEQPLNLPADIVIDLSNDPNRPGPPQQTMSYLPGRTYTGNNPDPPFNGAPWLDILFGQRGQLIGANSSGKVIMWLRNRDKAIDKSEQILIVVNPKTGLIEAQSVYMEDLTDPFRFTRDGKNSGM